MSWRSLFLGRIRAAETPILVRDPERHAEIPDTTLDQMVREKLRGDEVVFDWSEPRRGEVAVQLISAELDQICERISLQCDPSGAFGREGGCGRSLHFAFRESRWVFLGVGEWKS